MGLAGCFGHESTDAQTFTQDWDIDYLKYDFCNNPIANMFKSPYIGNVTVNGVIYSTKTADLYGIAHLTNDSMIMDIGMHSGEAVFYPNVPVNGTYNVSVQYTDAEGYRIVTVESGNETQEAAVTYIDFNPTASYNATSANTFTFQANFVQGQNKLRFYFDGDNADNAHMSY